MRKTVIVILLCIGILLSATGCSGEQREVTCEDVVAAYEEAGYDPSHHHSPQIGNMVCYVLVENDDDEQIYIHFFETAEEAEAEESQRQYNVFIWLFSVIFGDPTWVHTTTYRNIQIEYTDKALYEPFAKLIK